MLDGYLESCPSVIKSHDHKRVVNIDECCPDQLFPLIVVDLEIASR